MPKEKRTLLLRILFIPVAAILMLSVRFYAGNRAFQKFTKEMFQTEIAGNTLNLHYTLENPENYGIEDYDVTLGDAGPDALEASAAVLENYQERLDKIPYSSLNKDNKLTYDILSSYLENQASGKDFGLYAEPLGPTIGTQAQLPVLLAEYSFTRRKDIEDYLHLIAQMDTYYASIMEYEKAKSKAGLFMSDANADSIIRQCQAFIQDPKDNFLTGIFQEKIDAFSDLTSQEKTALKEKHLTLIQEHVIPAYEILIEGLTALKGTGVNDKGLCYLPDGKTYYEYLVRDNTGSYASIDQLEQRLQKQLKADFLELQKLIAQYPALLSSASPSQLSSQEPMEILSDLQQKISQDFPAPPEVSYEVKYVHKSLENFLSPAFYLTPPLDNPASNVIYINRASGYNSLELYTTLAHEGYPGHLYQTIYSGNTGENEVRSLLNFGGYVEGWATYVEMYSYGLAEERPEIAALSRLNRSITLGISCILDIAIHYHGYDRAQVGTYLSNMGFQNPSAADSFYNAILEAPGNYLKYYVGCLNFMDLRDAYKARQGEEFSLKEFHKKVLEIGPAPFSVVADYLGVE